MAASYAQAAGPVPAQRPRAVAPTTPDGTFEALTIASFNIRNGLACDGVYSWLFRKNRVLAAIAALGADLIGLQEVHFFQRRYLNRHLPEFGAVGRARGRCGWGEACPLFYRRGRLSLERHETLWFSPTPARAGSRWPGSTLPRVVSLALFEDLLRGGRFGAANLHLDHGRADLRTRSVALLLRSIDQTMPWLVFGDFNTTPAGPAAQLLEDAGYRDALAPRAPTGAGVATYHGFTGTLDGDRIDHIWIPRDWTVETGRIAAGAGGPSYASDHWPVTATVRGT